MKTGCGAGEGGGNSGAVSDSIIILHQWKCLSV